MNLDQIATKCFILALFIRDDGQRLLLGDGYYDFNQKLQHFQGNTIANDIVEIQGDNGQLLAGQVMRSGVQKFEGYIGDATTSRQIIEQKRSDFMAFFRIKHFYKVVYIFPDGTAIQRQRGYLTDAPTIPEIFQKFPEYSIALNFEDANYYEYAEDEHGDEIYAHIIELALSGAATGGLIWDAIGAVSNGISWSGIQTAQGEYISITNELDIPAKLASVEMLGNAEQDGTPTPDAPVAVETTTGENVVKIEGKNLFDKDAITSGKLIDRNTGALNNNASYATSDFMPVKAGEQYTYTGFNYWYACGFNSAKEWVSLLPNTATITIPDGVTYIRAGLLLTNLDTAQLELGSTATAYEPYHGQEFEVNLGKNLFDKSTFTNILNGSISDGLITSITWTNGSWAGVTANFGAITLNKEFTLSMDIRLTSGSTGTINKINDGVADFTQVERPTISTNWQRYAFKKTPTAGYSISKFFVQFTAINGSFEIRNVQIEYGSQATSYVEYIGAPIELAKIGTYQDRIYKDDGKWYIEKQVGKVVLDGSENWAARGTQYTGYLGVYETSKHFGMTSNFLDPAYFMCDHFKSGNGTYDATYGQNISSTQYAIYVTIDSSITADATAFTTWLASNQAIVYYALATPTTTEITNEALIAQLDALGTASLYVGVNNIGTETLNATPTLKIEYYTEVELDGAGYEWEPGGNTAKTIVTVAGVDSAWPIWTVQGGAQNPTLTNITTGQTISWQGFVPEGQTLTINMAEMTADLAGANVFEYVTGEWIRLAPGNNTLVYTAGNADKPSTLSWNGVLA